MMDVSADNYQVAASFNKDDGELEFTCLIKSFIFDLGLADRVINDERINVVAKPKVHYKGKVDNLGEIDFSSPGEYVIYVSGILYIWDMERVTGARGTLIVNKDGTIRASAKFKMTIEEESMNMVNELMKEHLPSAISVDANKLGISRDVYIESKMTMKPITKS